jgi:hypothetical protein
MNEDIRAILELPQYTKRKVFKGKKYVKPQSVKDFEIEHMHFKMKGKTLPRSLWVDSSFSDKTANDLTKLIMKWMEVHGHFAARINSGAVYDARLGCYRKGSGATVGMADINAVMGGKSVSIEVKIGKDKIRESQIKVKAQIEAAGGVYIVVRTFDDFLTQIKEL